MFQDRYACSSGERVCVECAVVRDASACVEFWIVAELDHVQDIRLAGHARAGQTAAQNLGMGREIGRHAVVPRRSIPRGTKSSNDLVHDEDDPIRRGDISKFFEEARLDGFLPHMGAGGLEDDSRCVSPFDRAGYLRDVVRLYHDH